MQGEILNGRYHIIAKLGRGGFGETYLATDQWLDSDNRCVVKQLRPNIINKSTLHLFEQEAQVLFKLGTHNQIPQLLAHFEQKEKFYLVQEYIQGHDLSEEIGVGCWDETEVIELLHEVLKILEFVHQNNVIHRDIKPANIMRRRDGKIVLIDFGGVKQLTTQTTTVSTHVVGTPGYMPFEQIHNNAQPCSDIYALGMVAIETLVGEDPIDIPTDSKTYQPIWRDQADVSEGLADVIDKMVRFSFEERYQSVSEALYAVKNIIYPGLDWYYKGEELYELQKYQKALAAFDKAIELQHDYAEAFAGRGLALHKLTKYHEALVACEQAIQLKSNCDKAWIGRAWALSSLGKHNEALMNYDRVIKFKNDDYIALTDRGISLNELGQYDKAIATCEQALQLKSNYHKAWIVRGIALIEIEQYDSHKALSVTRKALINLGRYDAGLKSCDRAIEIEPDDPDAWCGRGAALICLKRPKEALVSFNQALEIKPDNTIALINNGLALIQLQRFRKALASFDQALEIQPNSFYALHGRGFAFESMAKYSQALASFEQAIVNKCDTPKVLYLSGRLLLDRLKRYSEALTYLVEATQLKPNYLDAWTFRGLTLNKLGMYEQAILSFKQALTIKSDYILAIQGLALAEKKLRKPQFFGWF